ncbi:MAG: substrate-binding domain-containing protein [Bacteroidales bacterium]|nr:substrate-binding domain-containing protein [Bacteroidales bacterium]
MNRPFFFLVLISILILPSCNNSEKLKVGFLVPNLQSERYQREQALFTNKINELGGEALVASAEYDDKLQIDQASKMIKEGAKVLVVNSVNMNTAAAIVREAHENNVKVIAYDRVIQNCDLDIFISFDNVKVGKLMAEYTTRIKPEGNYVLIGGDKADLNAVLVKSGQLEVLEALVKMVK